MATPFTARQDLAADSTQFFRTVAFLPSGAVSRTLFTNELLQDEGTAPQVEVAEAQAQGDVGDDPTRVERAREDRLALLSLKEEGRATLEDKARIHLLTARLRRLDPRVTAAEREVAEAMVQSVEEIDAAIGAIRLEFGL